VTLEAEVSMPEDKNQIIKETKDRKERFRMAIELARGADPEKHRQLLSLLQSADFLEKLDSEDDYARASHLRVWRILDELGKNQAESALQALVPLTQSEIFLKEEARTERLITVCAVLHPPPPEVLKFWDDHCQPEDGFTPLTIDALGENGTEPALQLLEKKMADPAHSEGYKLGWLRNTVLVHRNDLPLLKCCRRMLSGGLPESLSKALVDVLFYYRLEEWFGTTPGPEPPDFAKANTEAKALLCDIARFALDSLKLTDDQRAGIEKTLKQIGK